MNEEKNSNEDDNLHPEDQYRGSFHGDLSSPLKKSDKGLKGSSETHKQEESQDNNDQKMLSIVNAEQGNELEKKDAIFLAFIADYSWDAVKKKNKNIKMPQPQIKMTQAEKNRIEKVEQQKKLDEAYQRMAENIHKQFQKKRA